VRLVSLRLLNFRQHADTLIDFDSGLTGVIGPNGSGKTTILEGIAWALYGNAAARGTRDSIRFVRAGARASVRVELEFDLGGHRYRVVRGLTNAELYLDGASTPIANSITGVGDLLQRRLGMSRTEFFNTYFTGQKELNVMAAMGPSERAQFLSRVLGYEKLRTAQTLVRDRRRMITAEMSGLRSGMPEQDAVWRMLAEAAESAERLLQLAPRWTRAQQERERLQELLGELRVAENEEQSVTRDVERAERELVEIVAARANLDALTMQLAPLAGLLAEQKRFEVLQREEGRRQTLLENDRVLTEELAKLTERHAQLASAPALEQETVVRLDAKRAEAEAAQAALEQRRTEWVRDQQEAATKLDALRAQAGDARAQRDRVTTLGPEGACPTCTRKLGENFRTVLDSLDEQIETLRVDESYFRNRLAQLKPAPEDVRTLEERRRALGVEVSALERRLAKCQLAMQEMVSVEREMTSRTRRQSDVRKDLAALPLGYDAERHALVRRQVEQLAPLEAQRLRAAALVEREGTLTADRDRAAGRRAALADRLAELRARRDSIQFSEQEYLALRTSHERAAADARAAELAAVTAQGDATGARASLDAAETARRDLARMQERLDALQAEKRLHDELDRAYSDLRTDLNFALRPELSELASAFIDTLTDSRYTELELDDQYNVVVLEDGVPKPVISGGEEDLANLVLRLAISQMIAERAGQSFSLLILDEVFGSLDESRRTNVVELLRRLNDRFEQVILITHIENVREGLDRVIQVRFDEESGSSKVEQGDDVVGLADIGMLDDGQLLAAG
jgi:exonuclease SbcC